MDEEITVHMLYEELMLLRVRQKMLERKINSLNLELSKFRKTGKYSDPILDKLVSLIENNMDPKHNSMTISLPYSMIKEELGIPNTTAREFVNTYSRKLYTHTDYFEHDSYYNFDKNETYYCFAIKPEKQNYGILKIADYLKGAISNCESDYIELNAWDIHKRLNLTARIPSVIKAMDKLFDESYDEYIDSKRTSKYTIKYKVRKFNEE